MLIETIFSRFFNLQHKINVFFLGIFVTIIGMFVGVLLFPGEILPGIFFATMPLVPFVNKIFDKKMSNKTIAKLYVFLFLGMIIVFAASYFFLSDLFDVTIYDKIGDQDPFMLFSAILTNNVKLIFILFLLSMLYGIGSLFILALNAALVGQLYTSFAVFNRMDLFMLFLPHTIIEIFSFFLAAIAGALLTIAFTTYRKRDADFDDKILQASIFFTFSIIAVMAAAVVESFMLPHLFVTFIG
ncbi:stage II sporulation protein M [Candidatus Aenigmatarchaeota archaeon]